MIDQELIEKNKQRLLAEKAHLEKLLSRVADKDSGSGEFKTKYPDLGNSEDENAAEFAEYETNIAEEHDLEERLHLVEGALEKISTGQYGICAVGGEEIPEARLTAVPEAQTCVEHA